MRRYREQCGRTQKEVAQLLNIDAQYYGEAERGRKRLSLECLTELCSFYRIPLDCLIPVPIREDESDREKGARGAGGGARRVHRGPAAPAPSPREGCARFYRRGPVRGAGGITARRLCLGGRCGMPAKGQPAHRAKIESGGKKRPHRERFRFLLRPLFVGCGGARLFGGRLFTKTMDLPQNPRLKFFRFLLLTICSYIYHLIITWR